MKIQVTQKNIDLGLRGSCSRDPVSLAMKDAGLLRVWVSPIRIVWVDTLAQIHEVETPEDVLQFIKNFDNEMLVDPFEFLLEES